MPHVFVSFGQANTEGVPCCGRGRLGIIIYRTKPSVPEPEYYYLLAG